MNAFILNAVPLLTAVFGALAVVFSVGIVKELLRFKAQDRLNKSRFASTYFGKISAGSAFDLQPRRAIFVSEQGTLALTFETAFNSLGAGTAKTFVFRPLVPASRTAAPGNFRIEMLKWPETRPGTGNSHADAGVWSAGSASLTIEAAAA